MTTSTSHRSTVYESAAYRSRNAPAFAAKATTVATIIASILIAVGAVSMIAGIVGAVGLVGVGDAPTAVLIGIGLIAMGSGGLLLVILQGFRLTHGSRLTR